MPKVKSSNEELNPDQPRRFVGVETKTLYLQYELDDHNKPKYSYKLISSLGPNGSRALDGRDQSQWSAFLYPDDLVDILDIIIDRDTTIIVKLENGINFYWSKAHNAIKTKNRHHEFYGDLLYQDGTVWKEREEFDTEICKAISFKAKYNYESVGNPQNHKFSYFVRYRDENQRLKEDEIDPDIKNPSV